MISSEIIAAVTLAASGIASLWKAFQVINELENEINSLKHKNDIHDLTLNGVRERMEHITARVSSSQQAAATELAEVSGWLAKNTAFEPRSRR